MKIALEEHFVLPDFLGYLAKAMPAVSKEAFGGRSLGLTVFSLPNARIGQSYSFGHGMM